MMPGITEADREREAWAAGILDKCRKAIQRADEADLIAAWRAEQQAAREQRMGRRA